jgi:hypothetical protein
LHIQGNRFFNAKGVDVKLLGSIVGCHLEGVRGWPGICDQSLQAIHDTGLNYTHIRTGPFTRQGESPDFEFYVNGDLGQINQAYLDLLTQTVALASKFGIYVEIDVFDRWVVQHGVSPWPGGLEQFQTLPTPIHEAYLAAVVNATCKFNPLYSAGNESFKSDSVVFTQTVLNRIHELCPGSLVGSNSFEGSQIADYIIMHTDFAPPAQAKPILVNEYGGAGLSIAEVTHQTQVSIKDGTYFMYWKGDHTASQWLAELKVLADLRDGKPLPPPPPAVCPRPDFEATGWEIACRRKGDLGKPACPAIYQTEFSAQLTLAEGHVPTPPKDAGEAQIVEFLDGIAADFQAQGLCAYHDHDAVMVRRSNKKEWFELHPWNFKTGELMDQKLAFTSDWIAPPAPPDEPPPPTGCSLKQEDISRWAFALKAEQGQIVDLTVYVCGALPLAVLNACGTQCCPLDDNKGNGACRWTLFGDPLFTPAGGTATWFSTAGPFTLKINQGDGFLTVKGSEGGPPAPVKWHVRAAQPPCDADANHVCLSSPLP